MLVQLNRTLKVHVNSSVVCDRKPGETKDADGGSTVCVYVVCDVTGRRDEDPVATSWNAAYQNLLWWSRWMGSPVVLVPGQWQQSSWTSGPSCSEKKKTLSCSENGLIQTSGSCSLCLTISFSFSHILIAVTGKCECFLPQWPDVCRLSHETQTINL